LNKKVLSFFSSGSFPLYKGDIFRTLALPEGYVIHFRYQRNLIQDEILSNLQNLKGEDGIIFYAMGNDQSLVLEDRNVQIYSIRRVLVRDLHDEEEDNLVHFFLELGDFVGSKPEGKTNSQLLPPYLHVSKIFIDEAPATWLDRVTLLKNEFGEVVFYLIKSITKDKHNIFPEYSFDYRSSFYNLVDESEYQVKITFFDTGTGENGIEVENLGLATLDVPPNYKIGAPEDTILFSLFTETLTTRNSRSSSRINIKSPVEENIDLSVQIRWNIRKEYQKSVYFGFFSLISGAGLLGLTVAFKKVADMNFGLNNWIIFSISLLLIWLGTSLLFARYNKK
jgi:hypothetical protein